MFLFALVAALAVVEMFSAQNTHNIWKTFAYGLPAVCNGTCVKISDSNRLFWSLLLRGNMQLLAFAIHSTRVSRRLTINGFSCVCSEIIASVDKKITTTRWQTKFPTGDQVQINKCCVQLINQLFETSCDRSNLTPLSYLMHWDPFDVFTKNK